MLCCVVLSFVVLERALVCVLFCASVCTARAYVVFARLLRARALPCASSEVIDVFGSIRVHAATHMASATLTVRGAHDPGNMLRYGQEYKEGMALRKLPRGLLAASSCHVCVGACTVS